MNDQTPAPNTRTRFDRVLLVSVLLMQVVVLVALAAFYFNSRRQHESVGSPPDINAPTPTQGALVLPLDPLPQPPSAQVQAAPPAASPASAADPFTQMHRQFARMQADMDRHMRTQSPWGNANDRFAPLPNSGSDLDAHIGRMMDNFMQDFRALENSMHFDEGWTALGRSPALDMQDAGRNYVVMCSLPGLDDTDINVTLEGRLLTIVGQSSSSARHPFETVQFERRVLLPGPVGGDDAAAMLTNGMLRIVVPKAEQMPQVAQLTRLM